MSQETSRNCADKLVQMNFSILGACLGVDCPPQNLSQIDG